MKRSSEAVDFGSVLRRFAVGLGGAVCAAALMTASAAQAVTGTSDGVRTRTAPLAVSKSQDTVAALPPAAATGTKRAAGWWAANAWWWWNPAGGWTLSITPTGLAQAAGTSATSRVWNDALAIAGNRWTGYSDGYSSMYEQLECHLYFRFKTPYNLDSWRPVVPWWSEVYHRCNPTGGD